jgi:hypothetical protein
MALDRIFDLEHLTHRMAHRHAVIDRDPQVRRARTMLAARTAIDENPYNAAPPISRKLDIDHFKPERLDRRL